MFNIFLSYIQYIFSFKKAGSNTSFENMLPNKVVEKPIEKKFNQRFRKRNWNRSKETTDKSLLLPNKRN